MSEAAKQKRRDYINNWRRKNPEKVKQYNKTYWERQAAKQDDKQESKKLINMLEI